MFRKLSWLINISIMIKKNRSSPSSCQKKANYPSASVYLNIFDIHLGCGRKFHPTTKPIATPIRRLVRSMIFSFLWNRVRHLAAYIFMLIICIRVYNFSYWIELDGSICYERRSGEKRKEGILVCRVSRKISYWEANSCTEKDSEESTIEGNLGRYHHRYLHIVFCCYFMRCS